MTTPATERATAGWPSLAPIDALAVRLLGPADGPAALDAWFAHQLERTADPAFARLFADHLDLPGIADDDYLHRIVEAEGLRVLGGIRFYAQDPTRPFVEAIAWAPLDADAGFDPWSGDAIERLRTVAGREWRAFSPFHLRLQLVEGDGAAHALPAGWTTDVAVHAADTRAMVPDDGAVALAPFDDPREALALVEARFAALRRDEPALARNVSPADADALEECHRAGSLFRIVADGAIVGLIATLPDRIDWLEGEVVMEEVVSIERAGHGYAAAAQRALGARYASDPDRRRLIGTIDGANVASARSAERAGRPVVSRYVFVPLLADAEPASASDTA